MPYAPGGGQVGTPPRNSGHQVRGHSGIELLKPGTDNTTPGFCVGFGEIQVFGAVGFMVGAD
jgi:hypothetical protein